MCTGRRLFGFFLGSSLTGASIYYYVLDEYKVSNELLTEDIYVSPPIFPILWTLLELEGRRGLAVKFYAWNIG